MSTSGALRFPVISPTTGAHLRDVQGLPRAEWLGAVEGAHEAQRGWQTTSLEARAAVLERAAGLLRGRTDTYARLMAEEMGKPLDQGRGEIEKCAWVCEYYAEQAAAVLAPESIATEAVRSQVVFRPLGVVLAIMPWNFPFWQVFRFAAPALMAGNAALLKPAPNVPGCGAAIEALWHEAGLPPALFRSLLVDTEAVGDLIDHPHVQAVTLTGSTRAGRAVAERAGRALKKTVLELGGSDPYVILADAHVEQAAQRCVQSRLINAGQSCIAAKRCIVVPEVRAAFEEAVVRHMRAAHMGDPVQEGVDLGPLARHDLRDTLHKQVQDSIRAGARCLLGGQVPEGPGAFYPPTVLTDVAPGCPAYHEELFGPVATILPATDEADALRIANDTAYGLGAALFTADVERGQQLAEEVLEAGCCAVNDFVRSDPRLPFGGIKDSGYGRELGSFGLREFVNVKTIYVGGL
ncbi:MAG: NAD-dependent succinate-semialdehyde dehydrogenase [Bacteroidota bacterium]